MTCPFCLGDMPRIADNLQFEAFGCENKSCAAWLYRPKPKPPVEQTIAPISEIVLPKILPSAAETKVSLD